MPINTADYHENNLKLTLALGDKLNAGDATFEPVGFDGMYLLVKQFPHPVVSGGAEIEVPMAGGGSYYEQAPGDHKFQGQFVMLETVSGAGKQFMRDVIAGGGYFDARIYEGTPARHTRIYLAIRCWVKLDATDRDWENRAQVMQLSGTLFGHYFGDEKPGNI